MEETWYVVEQQIRDRLSEARAAARARAIRRELASQPRGRYTLGMTLIRLGGWILAGRVALPIEVSRALVTLRAATDRSLRA